MFKSKSLIAKLLIVILLFGGLLSSTENILKKSNAATTLQIKDIPIGSLVVDKSWSFQRRSGSNYSLPNTVNEPIEWILIDKNSHFKQAYYENTFMDEHITLLSDKVIGGETRFSQDGANNPWHTRTIRTYYLRDVIYNSMSNEFKNIITLTATKTGQSASSLPVKTSNETLFLLSLTELNCGDYIQILNPDQDGLAIPFFNSNQRRSSSGDANNYFSRSAVNNIMGSSNNYNYIVSSGTPETGYNVSRGVRPATNLKANTFVKPTGVWKTSQAGDYVQVYEIVYNQPPTLSLTSPSNNRDLSEVPGYNVLTIGGQAHDSDVGDVVNIKYTIDGITAHTNRTLVTYTSNGAARTFSQGVPIDSTIPQGTYTLRVWAEDNKGGISSTVTRTIIVDKTRPTILANPTYWLDFGLAELDITVTLSDNLSGVEERMYRVTKSEETPTTWTAAPSNSFNIKLEEQGDWYLHVRVRDKAGNERIERFGMYRLMTEIPPPFGWGDEDLEAIKLPDNFDPDNMDGKIVEFNGKKAMVVVGRYIHLSAEDIDYATHYAISLDGYGYSHWKPLTDGAFEESVFINTPGLYPVHLKLKNAQYNVESDPFVRNFLVDWIKPEINSQTKVKGQTATTNGQLVIKATGEDNLTPVLYNAGSGWNWFTSGQDITATGIPINNRRNNVVIKFSDINGNVTEELYQIWGLSN